MSQTPAEGERGALRGYWWQYDHVAARVYDALVDADDFVAVRLSDPNAERVDDLVLVRRSSVEGFQFKNREFSGYITFHQLTRKRKSRSGGPAPSLARTLADGWRALMKRSPAVAVHFVTDELASLSDHLSDGNVTPDHFSAFVSRALDPYQKGASSFGDLERDWSPALTALQESAGLTAEELPAFLSSLSLDLGARPDIPAAPCVRRNDILALSAALMRKVSGASAVVELDRPALLHLMNWEDRPRLRSRHEFPVDVESYSPLEGAAAELERHLGAWSSGYIALTGPPGAGKSTLLSQGLSGAADRVVRYYAYVPGVPALQARFSAAGFLHDIVLMLRNAGVRTGRRELVSLDVDELRAHIAELLDACGQDFSDSGRRTVLIIDGLDHVERDYDGAGLLAELPRPAELPGGVVILVGSRTLTPLHASARDQIERHGTLVDLEGHRLSVASVMEVCRRVAATRDLPEDIHRLIAERSAGHPLALGYLLNRIRNEPEDAAAILAAAHTYSGDISGEYRAVWDTIADDYDVVSMLGVCSRLRIGFTTEWLESWAGDASVHTLRRRLLYLFRRHHDGWRFFHDSFRQYVAERTSLGDDGRPSAQHERKMHRAAADTCAGSDDLRFMDEELFHRFLGGEPDAVIALASQQRFREQCSRLRSSDLIRSDIALALDVAAGRADEGALLRNALALVELAERTLALEDIDMPALLFDVDLVDEAIAYCGGESRRVPLAHAYNLAARLADRGDASGRRIFDAVQHDGLDDPDRSNYSGQEDVTAVAWIRAAARFLPVSALMAACRRVLEQTPRRGDNDPWGRGELRRRFEAMTSGLVELLVDREDMDRLFEVDAALEQIRLASQAELTSIDADQRVDGDDAGEAARKAIAAEVATVVDLRVRVLQALIESTVSAERAATLLDVLEDLLGASPIYHGTMLDAAELFVRYERMAVAEHFLKRLPYDRALVAASFGSMRNEDPISDRHRFLRAYQLVQQRGGGPVPPTRLPDSDHPAGDGIDPGAPVHRDADSIELAGRIENAVSRLAELEAAVIDDLPNPDAWITLLPLLDMFRPTGRSSSTYGGIRGHRTQVLQMVVRVANLVGEGVPEKLIATLQSRFAEQPHDWPNALRLALAEEFRDAGVEAPWYRASLLEWEASAGQDQDAHSRLETTADVARLRAAEGRLQEAQRLAVSMVSLAFSVGYRKDYQFHTWVGWLNEASPALPREGALEAASWLARLVVAVDPMTEGAPGAAAVNLPAAVVGHSPTAAIRIFEFLVRRGTVAHLHGLTGLATALIRAAGPDERSLSLRLVTDLVTPAADVCDRELARALLDVGMTADEQAWLLDRIDRYALGSARGAWRSALGLDDPVPSSAATGDEEISGPFASDYGSLLLSSGERLTRKQAEARMTSLESLIELRTAEAPSSTYDWEEAVVRLLSAAAPARLAPLFDRDDPRDAEVIARLAERCVDDGQDQHALAMARRAFHRTRAESWSHSYGSGRRRCAALLCHHGNDADRTAVWRDLVDQLSSNKWLAGMLVDELSDVINAIAPNASMAALWPDVRIYLEGIGESLDLDVDDPLSDRGTQWWNQSAPSISEPVASAPCALAELAARHLVHPAWVLRMGSIRVASEPLAAGHSGMIDALTRLLAVDDSDELHEQVAACCRAAIERLGGVVPDSAAPLVQRLRDHGNHLVRSLVTLDVFAKGKPKALSPKYSLALPATTTPTFLESDDQWPYDEMYETLAAHTRLSVDTLVRIAEQYGSEAARTLPTEQDVRASMQRTDVPHLFRIPQTAARRAALGRVLSDLVDAGLLDNAPASTRHALRLSDPALFDRSPLRRPLAVAGPPEAGHDQTAHRWTEEIEDRLTSYVEQAIGGDEILVGCDSQLTVLNWDLLEEHLTCTLAIGATPPRRPFSIRESVLLRDLTYPVAPHIPMNGSPLVMQNVSYHFEQLNAGWLALRRDLTAAMGWAVDSDAGVMTAADKREAGRLLWWTDGWWGRNSRMFDDTNAEGHSVLLTKDGASELCDRLEDVFVHFELTRRDRRQTKVAPVTSRYSVALGDVLNSR